MWGSLTRRAARRWSGCLAGAVLLGATPAFADFEEAVHATRFGEYRRAAAEFRRLADAGDARGQNGLGVLHLRGMGVGQDLAAALRWFRHAAAQGYPAAQANLGLLYANGWGGVPKDMAQAYRWYLRAARQGDAEAQTSVGLMLAQGRGTRKDQGAAFRWFERAARQGHVEAWAHLGHMYRAGDGVPRDYLAAYAWYGISAAGGYPAGPELRGGVERFLTENELEEARSLARTLYALYGGPMHSASHRLRDSAVR